MDNNSYKGFINNDFLVWTMTTNGYKYLTLNLVESLKKAKISWYASLMVICVDRDSYTFMRSMNIPCVYYKPKAEVIIGTQPSQFGSQTFMTFNKIKLDLMEEIRVKAPEQVKYITYMDGDIVVFRDFIPYIRQKFIDLSNNLLFFQNDDLYGVPNTRANGCTGFFSLKRTFMIQIQSPFYVNDLNLWKEIREDQIWVNNKIVEYKIPFDYLERELFPNGPYVKNGAWRNKASELYLIHYNYIVGTDKVNFMKRLKHWFLIY
jgi:signal peptidase I